MSQQTDGTYRCDRCGFNVGNGGVAMAAIVATLAADGQTFEQLHLCHQMRSVRQPDGTERMQATGCSAVVFSKGTLAWRGQNG